MEIIALGYVGVRSARLDDWGQFATRLLGMQQVDRAGALRAFRMDDRAQRLMVEESAQEELGYLGFEVADAAALNRLAARLDAAGIAVRHGDGLADARMVAGLIRFQDPEGNELEVFHGGVRADTPFTPGRTISGFRTGPLGMGHVVFNVENIERMLPFYRDLLSFRVSDYGLKPYGLYFFHINARHHSFAMVGSGRRGFHHFMIELFSLDDVGQGYDLALLDPERVAYTLGRHTNDFMTSFYMHTPSGFFVETGWGGRSIDPATWQAHETTDGPSLWGHERPWMPPEQQDSLRRMRLDVAARGIRQPVQVMAGNYDLGPGICPWLEAQPRG